MKKLLVGGFALLALSGCGINGTNLASSGNNTPAQSDQTIGNTTDNQVVCTMEAKQCPDGSYVGRQGPKCEFAACPTQANNPGTSTAITTPVISITPLSSTQTYKNAAYNFQFDYGKEFAFVNVNYANLDEKVVQVQMPGDSFAKTNLGDAGFAVSVGTAKTEKECLTMNLPEGGASFTKKATINGQVFYTANGSGAGAGNLYESKNYRTFASPTCYEVTETIHTANIGNFDPGTVKEVDKTAVWAKLDEIMATFKLTK